MQEYIEPKGTFQIVFIEVIAAIASNSLTSETSFLIIFLLLIHTQKFQISYGTERISTEEVMDKLDIFQYGFGKIDEFGWWYLKILQLMLVHHLPPRNSRKNVKPLVFI